MGGEVGAVVGCVVGICVSVGAGLGERVGFGVLVRRGVGFWVNSGLAVAEALTAASVFPSSPPPAATPMTITIRMNHRKPTKLAPAARIHVACAASRHTGSKTAH